MSGCSGHGRAIGHAGEILQGAIRMAGGIEPFLVTLPVPEFQSTATVQQAATWCIEPQWKMKTLRATQLAMGSKDPLAVTISSNIPVGRGCGSSTADCVAAVRAVADLLDASWEAEDIARLVHRAELASDSTMFDLRPVAFLPRMGELLRSLGMAWPPVSVDVIDMGGPDVATLDCGVSAYTERELDEFVTLLDDLERAIGIGDVRGIGRVALRSAEIQQRYRPHSCWDAVRVQAMAEGASGVAVAHSGTVAAVLGKGACNVDLACGRG